MDFINAQRFDDGVIVHEIPYDDTNDKTFASEPTSSRRKIDKDSESTLSTQDPTPTINQNTSRTNMCAVMRVRRDINGCIQITTN